MLDKFCVEVTKGPFQDPWPEYFDKFYKHCQRIAILGKYNVDTVINYELKPFGRLIKTKTQGWYLRWDDPKYHTLFVLKWS